MSKISSKSAGPVAGLLQVVRLIEKLDEESVKYLHWKSNDVLDRSLSGLNDLDLLVAQESKSKFLEILNEFTVKKALPPKGAKLVPGIDDFYGLDFKTQTIFHIHVHYKLIVGNDSLKNFHVNLEELYFLRSRKSSYGLVVPDPTLDFIMFNLRMALKFSPLSFLKNGHYQLGNAQQSEFEDLRSKVNREDLKWYCSQANIAIDVELIEAIETALIKRVGLLAWIRIQRNTENRLVAFALKNKFPYMLTTGFRYLYHGISARLGRKVSSARKLTPTGQVIAITGGDGAGKTTVIKHIIQKYGEDFDVKVFHMGKPRRSYFSLLVDVLLKLFRLTPKYNPEFHELPRYPGKIFLLRKLLLARDRVLQAAKVRRIARGGAMVICDRWPLADISIMDGPVIRSIFEALKRKCDEKLCNQEENWYSLIGLPDKLLVLDVDPEIAVKRKTDEPSDYVERRNRGLKKYDWTNMNADIVDANRSPQDVAEACVMKIWQIT